MEKWRSVQPGMILEEEESEDFYIRHRPSWRSTEFNDLMDLLDQRHLDTHKKAKAFERSMGETLQKEPPAGTEAWMLNEDVLLNDVTE